jgi:hypothetical protein
LAFDGGPAEPVGDEGADAFDPDDDRSSLTTISVSWKTDGPASGLQANGGGRSIGTFERVA